MSSVKSIYNLLNFGLPVHDFLIFSELGSSSDVKFVKKTNDWLLPRVLFSSAPETAFHAFIECSFIKLILQGFADKLDISSWPLSLVSFWNDFRSAVKREFINA